MAFFFRHGTNPLSVFVLLFRFLGHC